MAEQSYNYSLSADFPGGKINSVKLAAEISSSAITVALARVDTAGDAVSVVFKAPLPAEDEDVLDGGVTGPAGGLIAAHDSSPSVVLEQKLSSDGVALAKPQPQVFGHEMCERDFKITTCKVSQADAVEDMKVNPVTLKEEDWAGPELSLVGVYKDVSGTMVPCADQADADLNGVLSVFDYKAYDQADGVTEIPYDIRSGALVGDPGIATVQRFDHRAYLVMVPDLGQPYWVRIFDGYVTGRPQEGELSTESPAAKQLDPSMAPGANVARLYIFHPQGQSNAHILWLLTYRPTGTF